MKFATWSEAADNTPEGFGANDTLSVPFVSGEGGYFCIKIPVMITLQNGDVLAMIRRVYGEFELRDAEQELHSPRE